MQEAIMTPREERLRQRVEAAIRQLEDETKLQSRDRGLLKRFTCFVAKFFGGWPIVGKGKWFAR